MDLFSALLAKGVRFPKVLVEERDSPVFEHGFLIVEYIDGELALDALHDGKISFDDYYAKLLKELQKVHTIHVPKFGYTRQGEGSHENYIEFMLEGIRKKIEELSQANVTFKYGQKLIDEIEQTKLFVQDIPSLVHHDIGLDNVLIDPNNEIFIIDWDSALSHPWSLDLAYLTFPARDIWNLEKHSENVTRIHRLIQQNYDLPVSFEEFLLRERIHHVNYLIGFIHHEYFNLHDLNEANAYLNYCNQLMESV
ncbi:MAG: phosphotransferase [Candidatus Dojkabacteria bacterium]